jgi:hypothetical protein
MIDNYILSMVYATTTDVLGLNRLILNVLAYCCKVLILSMLTTKISIRKRSTGKSK